MTQTGMENDLGDPGTREPLPLSKTAYEPRTCDKPNLITKSNDRCSATVKEVIHSRGTKVPRSEPPVTGSPGPRVPCNLETRPVLPKPNYDPEQWAAVIWRTVASGEHSNSKHAPAAGCTRRCLTFALRNHTAADVDAALAWALSRRWLVAEGGRFWPGESRPAPRPPQARPQPLLPIIRDLLAQVDALCDLAGVERPEWRAGA